MKKVILIILWATLISFCLTAPVIDTSSSSSSFDEHPEDELLSIIELIPDTVPFVSELRFLSANPPDFNNPSIVIAVTDWFETRVFPEMKRVRPILSEARGRGLEQSEAEYQNLHDTALGLFAVEVLVKRIRLNLVEFSNHIVPIELDQALLNWILVDYKYHFERGLCTMMGYSRGFLQKPTVSKAEGLQLIQDIVYEFHLMKYAQFIHNLYESGTTIEHKVYKDFLQIQNDSSFSIDKFEQFIASYYYLYIDACKSNLPLLRFRDEANVKYIPASNVENSDNPQASHTMTSSKRKNTSTEQQQQQQQTLETGPIPNSKRQKLSLKEGGGVSLNLHSALLNSILGHTNVINLWLSKWIDNEENTDSIDFFSKFSHDLEIFVIPWCKQIGFLLDSFLPFPEIEALESLDPAMKALGKVYTLIAKVSKIFPKQVFQSVTFAKFWKAYHRICLQEIYIEWEPTISEENILDFMKESSSIVTLIKECQDLFEMLSEGKTAESMIDENIKKFRQKSEISQEDVEQFATMNGNFLNLMKANDLEENSDGRIIMDNLHQRMPECHDLSPRQLLFDRSHPSVNIEHNHDSARL